MVVQAAGIAMIDSYRGMRKVVFGGRGLCKTYGSVTALDGVDIDVYEREIVAVVGDNGAGKSTLVRVLSGLEYPDDGCVLRNGEEISFFWCQGCQRRWRMYHLSESCYGAGDGCG